MKTEADWIFASGEVSDSTEFPAATPFTWKAQVFGLFPGDKYGRRSYANIASVLSRKSGIDATYEYVRRRVFSVLIGNADTHLELVALVSRPADAPFFAAYDFVATLPYIPNDDLALSFGDSRSLAEITTDRMRHFVDTARSSQASSGRLRSTWLHAPPWSGRPSSRPSCSPKANARVVVRGLRTAVCWKGFCGFCGAGLAGRTCRRNFRIPRPAGGDARLGRAGRLVEHLAGVSERVERAPAIEVERIVSGRQFRSGEKGAAESEKPSGARGRSGWLWSTAAVFFWESTFTLHPRRKSNLRKRRSRRSA